MAQKSRLQEGVILSTTWLARTYTLYGTQLAEPCIKELNKYIELDHQMTKETSNPLKQPPLALDNNL